jgi:cytochrome oxidase Cu insertion factor (SCO1/SenC/PrrC family)
MTPAEFDALVASLRDRPDLLADLLPESLPLYAGCSPGQVARMRGHLLAVLGAETLPDKAIPFVVEALETGVDAVELAGAARGLRGCARPPAGVAELVDRALARVADSTVDLTTARAGAGPGTRARAELARTREYLAARPAAEHCCHAPAVAGPAGPIVLQDQDGVERPYAEAVAGPAVVAFFYTRCDNPYRCSATVARLADLRRRHPVRIAAITYDPAFDTPARLRRYGRDRGITFDDRTRLYRATAGFAELRRGFELAVNYSGSTVNRHAIELHVLGADGQVGASFRRTRWTVDEVLAVV